MGLVFGGGQKVKAFTDRRVKVLMPGRLALAVGCIGLSDE
jgi:hypothetical protein